MIETPQTSTGSDNANPPTSRNRVEPGGIHQPGKTASPATRTRTATLPSHRFKYAGRFWRIYKRTAASDAPWYLQFQRDGQRYPASLKTASKAHAELEAKSFIDAWQARARADRSGITTRAASYSTVGELFATVEHLNIKANTKSRLNYTQALTLAIRRALDLAPAADINALSCGIFTDKTAAAYFARMESEAAKCPTQLEALRLRRTWVSEFNTAKALFAPRSEYQLRQVHGLRLPPLLDWQRAIRIHGPQKLSKGADFQRPDDAILRRTLQEWVKLGRTPGYRVPGCDGESHGDPLSELDRRNMFIAIGLELACGLRKSETLRVRESWSKTFSGVPHLSDRDTTAKDGSASIEVVPVNPYWRVLQGTIDRNGWRGAPEELLLRARPKTEHPHRGIRYTTGGESDREVWPFWLIGRWLRGLGWETQKTNHALRDWTASLVTMKFGLNVASAWCRHKKQDTTQAHYNRFVTLAKQTDARKLAWFKWAK